MTREERKLRRLSTIAIIVWALVLVAVIVRVVMAV